MAEEHCGSDIIAMWEYVSLVEQVGGDDVPPSLGYKTLPLVQVLNIFYCHPLCLQRVKSFIVNAPRMS